MSQLIETIRLQTPHLHKIFAHDPISTSKNPEDAAKLAAFSGIRKVPVMGFNGDAVFGESVILESERVCSVYLRYNEALSLEMEKLYRRLKLMVETTVGAMALQHQSREGANESIVSEDSNLYGEWRLFTDRDIFWWEVKIKICWLIPKKSEHKSS